MLTKCKAKTVVTMPTRSDHSCTFTGRFGLPVIPLIRNYSMDTRDFSTGRNVIAGSPGTKIAPCVSFSLGKLAVGRTVTTAGRCIGDRGLKHMGIGCHLHSTVFDHRHC